MVNTRAHKRKKADDDDVEKLSSSKRSRPLVAAASSKVAAPARASSPDKPHVWYPTRYYLGDREEYQDMLRHLYTQVMVRGDYRIDPGAVCDAFSAMFFAVTSWVGLYGTRTVSHLSDADKREIIASLDGYCVQEGWDQIRLTLPPLARAEFGTVLLETMINQFICTKFVDNRFWFMDAKIDAADREGAADFSKRFQYLYDRFKETQPMDAAWWKSLIVHTCNVRGSFIGDPPPTELGQSVLTHRRTLVQAYTDELLGRRIFQLLLRDPQDDATRVQRDASLRSLLERAGEAIIRADSGLYGNMTIQRLAETPKFIRRCESMTSHFFHAGAAAVQGAYVLIVTRPGYSYTDIQSIHTWKKMEPLRVNPVQVLVAPKGPKALTRWLNNRQYDREDPVDDDEEQSPYEPPKLRKTFWRQ